MADLESPEAFAERLLGVSDGYARGENQGAIDICGDYAALIRARDEAIRADERAKVEAERNALMLALKALLTDPQGSREMCQRVADDPAFMSQAFVAEYVKRRELNDDAVRRIAELEAKVEAERWIPVGERLPDPLEVVLIYPFNVDDPLVGYRQFDNWWGDNDEHEPKPIFHVTHWRHLPAPPTDAERKDGSRG